MRVPTHGLTFTSVWHWCLFVFFSFVFSTCCPFFGLQSPALRVRLSHQELFGSIHICFAWWLVTEDNPHNLVVVDLVGLYRTGVGCLILCVAAPTNLTEGGNAINCIISSPNFDLLVGCFDFRIRIGDLNLIEWDLVGVLRSSPPMILNENQGFVGCKAWATSRPLVLSMVDCIGACGRWLCHHLCILAIYIYAHP